MTAPVTNAELARRLSILEGDFRTFKKEVHDEIQENTELVRENTKVTTDGLREVLVKIKGVDEKTSGVVTAFEYGKGGLKVLGVLGRVAGSLSAVGAIVAAGWLYAIKWWRSGG